MLDEAIRKPRGFSETATISDVAKSAWRIRNHDGDIVGALALIKAEGNLEEESDDLALLKMLFESERFNDFQQAISRSIERLGSARLNPSSEYLVFLLHQSERACLASDKLDALLDIARPHRRRNEELARTTVALYHRQKYRRVMADRLQSAATIISLGVHCLPWSVPCRWGWRSEADFYTAFNPFCLAVHRTEGVVKALSEDFESYFREDQLLTISSTHGHSVVARKDRGAVWNHNKGEYWVKNDFQALRENMKWKIANFRETCRRPHPVFLLGNCLVDYPSEPLEFLEPLKAALARYTGREDNHLIITNQRMAEKSRVPVKIDDTTYFFSCPYPDKAYIWHDQDTGDSRPGLIYERHYLGAVQQCLTRWGLLAKN